MPIEFSTEIPTESKETYVWTLICGQERISIKLDSGTFLLRKEGEKCPIMPQKAGFFGGIRDRMKEKKKEDRIRAEKEKKEKEELEKTLKTIKDAGEWTEL